MFLQPTATVAPECRSPLSKAIWTEEGGGEAVKHEESYRWGLADWVSEPCCGCAIVPA